MQPKQPMQPAQQPGDLVADRYRTVSVIGQGGMGRVLLAEDQLLGRQVALKQIQLPSGIPEAERAQMLDRVRREARIAANLDHPAIVRVHDIVEHQGSPVIVMEYLNGRSLGATIREGGPLHPAHVAQIAASVLHALDHAHGAGVVHRDLKPDNIVLTRDGRTVLTDFGIARMVDGGTSLTAPGTVPGTPAFMSPEQIEGREVSGAADLSSLGATLYAALEGRPPFGGDTLTELCVAILTRPTPASHHAGELGQLLDGLLAKDVSRRATVPQALQFLADPPSPAPYAPMPSAIADHVDSSPLPGFSASTNFSPVPGPMAFVAGPPNETPDRTPAVAPALTIAASAAAWIVTLFLPQLHAGSRDSSYSGWDVMTGRAPTPYAPLVWALVTAALIMATLAAATLLPSFARHAARVCWAAIPLGLLLAGSQLTLGVLVLDQYQSACDGGVPSSSLPATLLAVSRACHNQTGLDFGFYLGIATAALLVAGGVWSLILHTRTRRANRTRPAM